VNVIQTNIFGGFDEITHERINLKLFVSAATLLKYRLHGGKLNKSNGVLYNPVQEDHTLIEKINESGSEDLIIGRIARPDILKWDSNFEIFLQLLAECGLKFKLRIVGAPLEIKNRLNQTGARIEYIEKIESAEKLNNFYGSLDILVHMSAIGESFGCIFVESMNFGVPIVTNSTPITKFRFWRDNAQVEVIDNGITGFVCKNTIDMRNAVQFLASNPISALSIREQSIARFKTDKIVKQLDEFYKKTIAAEKIEVNLNELIAEHSIRRLNLFKTPFISLNQRIQHQREVASVSWLCTKKKLKITTNYFGLN
jgi:glycosyltransferase involved in cell wall biosynthesis